MQICVGVLGKYIASRANSLEAYSCSSHGWKSLPNLHSNLPISFDFCMSGPTVNTDVNCTLKIHLPKATLLLNKIRKINFPWAEQLVHALTSFKGLLAYRNKQPGVS